MKELINKILKEEDDDKLVEKLTNLYLKNAHNYDNSFEKFVEALISGDIEVVPERPMTKKEFDKKPEDNIKLIDLADKEDLEEEEEEENFDQIDNIVIHNENKYDQGHSDGYEDGYKDGYDEGYEKAFLENQEEIADIEEIEAQDFSYREEKNDEEIN